jgi:hypothetical protein
MQQLRDDLARALKTHPSLKDLSVLLAGHRDQGRSQADARLVLTTLLHADDELEDAVMDALDVVEGYVGADLLVWETVEVESDDEDGPEPDDSDSDDDSDHGA